MFYFTYFLDKKRDREERGERKRELFYNFFLFVGVDHAERRMVDCGLRMGWMIVDGWMGWMVDRDIRWWNGGIVNGGMVV